MVEAVEVVEAVEAVEAVERVEAVEAVEAFERVEAVEAVEGIYLNIGFVCTVGDFGAPTKDVLADKVDSVPFLESTFLEKYDVSFCQRSTV